MAESLLTGDKVLCAVVESNYGVPETVNETLNAMRVKADLKVEAEAEEMDYDAGQAGAKGQIEKYRKVTGSLDGYLSPSTAPNVAPAITPLLRAAGLSVTPGADRVNIALDDISNTASATLAYLRSKQVPTIAGWRSDWSIAIKKGDLAKLTFPSGAGIYAPETDVGSLPTPDFSGFLQPHNVDHLAFSVAQVYGVDVDVSEAKVSGGNTVEYIVESGEVVIVDRKLTAEVTFKEPSVSVKDWEAELFNYGLIKIQLGLDGVDTGKIFEWQSSNAQLVSLERTDINNVSYLVAKFDLIHVGRNDEFTAVFR